MDDANAERQPPPVSAPYRVAVDATIARPLRRAPLVLRLIACFVPDGIGCSYRWYRRACGARWAVLWRRDYPNAEWESRGWCRVPECPRQTYRRATDDVTDYVGSRGECTSDRCMCEDWREVTP